MRVSFQVPSHIQGLPLSHHFRCLDELRATDSRCMICCLWLWLWLCRCKEPYKGKDGVIQLLDYAMERFDFKDPKGVFSSIAKTSLALVRVVMLTLLVDRFGNRHVYLVSVMLLSKLLYDPV